MSLAETIYKKSLALSPEKAVEVIDFIDFISSREPDAGQKQPSSAKSARPFLEAFEKSGLVGCLETDEQLAETYKEKVDYSYKHGEPT